MYQGEKLFFEQWDDNQCDNGMEALINKEGKAILRIWSAGFNAREIDIEELCSQLVLHDLIDVHITLKVRSK